MEEDSAGGEEDGGDYGDWEDDVEDALGDEVSGCRPGSKARRRTERRVTSKPSRHDQ
jgi:hypothetical protein